MHTIPIEQYSVGHLLFAHWCHRIEDCILSGEEIPQHICKAALAKKSGANSQLIFELLDAKIEPVFSDGRLVGYWKNIGNKPRPKKGRFFEHWNPSQMQFDMWIYHTL